MDDQSRMVWSTWAVPGDEQTTIRALVNDVNAGQLYPRTDDPRLFDAIGIHGRAQHHACPLCIHCGTVSGAGGVCSCCRSRDRGNCGAADRLLCWLQAHLDSAPVQDYFNAPRVIGKTLEINPLAQIFGVLAGGEIAGVVGALISVPAIATLRIVWRRIRCARTQEREESPSGSAGQIGRTNQSKLAAEPQK
jgi:hypothetical protein